jgi:hypothetical protein
MPKSGARAESVAPRFIEDARRSRLGLHQDVKRTKNLGKFRELLSGKVIEAFPSVEEYGKGEILLVRALPCGDEADRGNGPRQALRVPRRSAAPCGRSRRG